MKQSIGVYEAKNNFTKILKQVANGEQIDITKHGKPIATITPFASENNNVLEALQELEVLANRVNLKGANIRNMIDEGRK